MRTLYVNVPQGGLALAVEGKHFPGGAAALGQPDIDDIWMGIGWSKHTPYQGGRKEKKKGVAVPPPRGSKAALPFDA